MASLGAGIGSLTRYELGRLISRFVYNDFPWPTWIINMLGSVLLVVFFRQLQGHHLAWWTFIGTGFCGGFTTFSTMSVEARQLFRVHKGLAFVYLASSLIGGVALAYVARWI
ncbi:fluoride efflux transporter FluC [Alicyclobacillus shizuokensis]|uniref:fluoride efflux transporter FluC n=1 Tax=Alicyclobacillus shizuokensis TaxID=392014 RepID=UPI0035716A3A